MVLFFLFKAHIILNYLEMVSASGNRDPAGSTSEWRELGVPGNEKLLSQAWGALPHRGNMGPCAQSPGTVSQPPGRPELSCAMPAPLGVRGPWDQAGGCCLRGSRPVRPTANSTQCCHFTNELLRSALAAACPDAVFLVGPATCCVSGARREGHALGGQGAHDAPPLHPWAVQHRVQHRVPHRCVSPAPTPAPLQPRQVALTCELQNADFRESWGGGIVFNSCGQRQGNIPVRHVLSLLTPLKRKSKTSTDQNKIHVSNVEFCFSKNSFPL